MVKPGKRTLSEPTSPLSAAATAASKTRQRAEDIKKKRTNEAQKDAAKTPKEKERERDVPDARAAPPVASTFSVTTTASALKKMINKPPTQKEGISQLKCNKGVEYGIYAGYMLLVRRLIGSASQRAKASGSKQITEQHIEAALKEFY